jgi:hypothetical protein
MGAVNIYQIRKIAGREEVDYVMLKSILKG